MDCDFFLYKTYQPVITLIDSYVARGTRQGRSFSKKLQILADIIIKVVNAFMLWSTYVL